jgi:DNA-directed RNA polymerase specialized sigma24 family protein
MPAQGSVTGWFDKMRYGDSEAVRTLWERYFPRLVEKARTRLRFLASAAADEEDVAASAMESFFQSSARRGGSPIWRIATIFGGCYYG